MIPDSSPSSRTATTLPFLVAFTALAVACLPGDKLSAGRPIAGETVKAGAGAARGWIVLDEESKPSALGVTFNDGLLRDTAADVSSTLALPFNETPFGRAELLWYPRGHGPAGVYDVAHVDVNFYLVGTEDRLGAIAAVRAGENPGLEVVPGSYVPASGLARGRATRWVDVGGPEFAGSPFTHTLQYGFRDGQMVFISPSVSRVVLSQRQAATGVIKQPRVYAKPGLYPTRYRITYDSARNEHSIALEGLKRPP